MEVDDGQNPYYGGGGGGFVAGSQGSQDSPGGRKVNAFVFISMDELTGYG